MLRAMKHFTHCSSRSLSDMGIVKTALLFLLACVLTVAIGLALSGFLSPDLAGAINFFVGMILGSAAIFIAIDREWILS